MIKKYNLLILSFKIPFTTDSAETSRLFENEDESTQNAVISSFIKWRFVVLTLWVLTVAALKRNIKLVLLPRKPWRND